MEITGRSHAMMYRVLCVYPQVLLQLGSFVICGLGGVLSVGWFSD
jgi:hypothetical protein